MPSAVTATDLKERCSNGLKQYRLIESNFLKGLDDIGASIALTFMASFILTRSLNVNGERLMELVDLEKIQEVLELLMAEVGLSNIPVELEPELEHVLTVLNEEITGALYGSEKEGTESAVASDEAADVEVLAV